MKKIAIALLAVLSFQAKAQTITTIAGTGFSGFTSDGVPATSSGVYQPYDVGMDALGNIYIGDVGNNRIRKINTAGVISTVAGTGTAGYNGDGIVATSAHLNFPYGMAVNSAGMLVITDMNNNRIRVIQSEAGGIIMTMAGTGVAGYSGDGGPATAAQINNPQGIFWDESSNVYFSDAWNHRVRKISGSGIISTIGGNGLAGSGGDGGPATAASINHPSGIAADAAGNIYVAEMYGHRIRKISTTGIITTVAGTGVLGFSGDGGPATLAMIRDPKGVCIDRLGNILICDTDNQLVRKIDVTTGIITTIAGTPGAATYGGDGGPATLAKLNFAQGIYVDTAGNIYIGDCVNNRVRKIACVTPTVNPISGADTVCVGSSITLTSTTPGGTWTSVNAKTTVAGAGVVTGVTMGLDTIQYVVANSCATASVSHAVYVKTCTIGIAGGNTAENKTGIYPNPATNMITVIHSQNIDNVTIADASGRVVCRRTFNARLAAIDIVHLPNGIYFVKVNGAAFGKFIKE